jgi:hypothetical protein
MDPVSVENAFISYLSLQGRWLLCQLKRESHVQHDEVLRRLSAGYIFPDNLDAQTILKQEVQKEWKGEQPGDCFVPLNQALNIGFPNYTRENMKRELLQSPTKHPLKRRRIVEG